MTERVLITGAAGFIGSNLVTRCMAEGWAVRGVDDMSSGHRELLHPAFNASSLLVGDFISDAVLSMIKAQQCDVVFHLAATPRVSYSVEHPLETHDNNVTKTLKLIDACVGNVKRFVFASSSSVYGGAVELPTPETAPTLPKSPYALQKLIIENYLGLYSSLYGLDSASLRFFNVFGPGQVGSNPYATAIAAWLTAIKRGEPMRSDGDGYQTRDMCYVDNVTDACVKAAQRKVPLMGARYNVACGDNVSNNDILGVLRARYPEATVVNAPARRCDVLHTMADVSKAQIELGYVPLVKFWPGLIKTIHWWESNWEHLRNM
jgi:UDP-glucose 4-epimerase